MLNSFSKPQAQNADSCYWMSHLCLSIGSENLPVDQDNISHHLTADNVLTMQGDRI